MFDGVGGINELADACKDVFTRNELHKYFVEINSNKVSSDLLPLT